MSLRTENGAASGTTRLLEVDEPRGLLLLETLHDADAAVAAGDMLHLETDLDDRRITLGCRVRDLVQLPDGSAYMAEQPVLRLNESRRSSQRLRLDSTPRIDAAIRARHSGNLPVQVLDVSSGGFGAQLSCALNLPDGMRVNCTLDLPEVKVFVEATVRHTRMADGGVRVGLQFSEMTPLLEHEMKLAMEQLSEQLQRAAEDHAAKAPPSSPPATPE